MKKLLIIAAVLLFALPGAAGLRVMVIGGAAGTPADVTIYPTSDGTGAADWTASAGTDRFAMVDETSHDSDSTYISRGYAASIACFDNLPSSLPDSPIVGIRITYVGRYESTDVNIISRMYVNGTLYNGDTLDLTSTSYEEVYDDWLVNPETSATWTKADVEGTGDNPLQQWCVNPLNQAAGEIIRVTAMKLTVRYN